MHWIGPTEKNTANGTLEKRLWDSAHQFRANSSFKAQEYSCPILGISEHAAPLFNGILTLQRQIRCFRRTRDLLLPRLLSGQVELATEAA